MKVVTRTLIFAGSLASVQPMAGPASAQIAQLPQDGSVLTFIPDETPVGVRCAGEREVLPLPGAAEGAQPPASSTTDPLCAAPSDPGAIGWSVPPIGDVTDRLGQFLQQIRSIVEPHWGFWLLSRSDRLRPDLRGGPTDVA